MKHTILFTLSAVLITPYLYAIEPIAPTKLPKISVYAEKNKNLKQQLGEATTATKGVAQLKDIPQIVNVVPNQILREQVATSMQAALQNVAGLSFSIGDGQRDQVMIRGFSAMTDNYVDGIRDDAMYFRDLSNVERIEVLKGPASVLYGRGSAGGLVNRINKKPSDQSLREVSLIGSTVGQRRAEADVNEKLAENMKLRLTGAIEDSDGYRQQAFLQREAVASSLLWNISAQTKLLLQADYLHDDRLADHGFPADLMTGKPVRTNAKTFYGAANAKHVGNVETEISSQTVSLDHEFDSGLKYRGVLRHYDYALDRQYAGVSHVDAARNPLPTDQIGLNQTKRLRGERGIFTQQELNALFATGVFKHKMLLGIEYSTQHKNEMLWSADRQITDLFQPKLQAWSVLDTTKSPDTNTRNRFENYAVYLQDMVELTAQLKLLTGLRYDHLSQNRNDQTLNDLDVARTDQTFSPRIGLVYQPSPNVSLYASYNQSFQPLADTFVFYRNSSDLKPTKTKNIEVGAKWDIDDAFNMTLSIFDMNQTNIQNQDPVDRNRGILAGEQKTKGIEISLTGQLTEQLSILAGYAYLDAEIEKSTVGFAGHDPALTPHNMANLWLKYQLNDHWFVALGGRTESSRYSAPDNKNILPGYAVVNAAVGYQSDQYDVNLNLNNLLDRDYFVSGNGGANDTNMMGDPLNAQLALRYHF